MCNYLRAVGLCPYGFAVCEESAGSFLDCGVGRVFFGLSRCLGRLFWVNGRATACCVRRVLF